MHTQLKQIIYLPNSLGVSKKKKKTTKRNTDELQMVSEKWQSLCFYLFTPSRKAGEGLRGVFSFNVATD